MNRRTPISSNGTTRLSRRTALAGLSAAVAGAAALPAVASAVERERLDWPGILARAEYMIATLRRSYGSENWAPADDEAAARTLRYFRACAAGLDDEEEWGATIEFFYVHSQSLDWVLYGDPATMIGGMAARSRRAAKGDPIFAVIRTHHHAMAHEVACGQETCRLEKVISEDRRAWHFSVFEDTPPEGCTDAPEWIKSQQNVSEALDLRLNSIEALLTAEPTTLAGAIALLEYLGSHEYSEQEGAGEPILFGVVDMNDERFPEVAWSFPARLATTMRSLIGGQS